MSSQLLRGISDAKNRIAEQAKLRQLKILEQTENVSEYIKIISLLYRGLAFVVSIESLFMSLITILGIFMVSRKVFNVTFTVEFAIFSAGCIFPMTFNVGASFKRKEKALELLATIKSNLISLFLMFVHFDVEGKGEASRDVLPNFRNLVRNIEVCLRNSKEVQYTTPVNFDGEVSGDRSAAHLVYDDLAIIAAKLQKHSFGCFGYDYNDKAVGTATQRSWQFIQDLTVAFEEVRAIRFSSTSVGLRLFSYFLINVSCVALSPYWASFCRQEHFVGGGKGLEDELGLGPARGSTFSPIQNGEATSGYGCASAYLVGLLFTFIVFALYRVQRDLEDPFSGSSDDSIRWDRWKQQLETLGKHGVDGPTRRATMAQQEAQQGEER
uniref:Uncharacterized protein n=2 Tax=Guillardia theta TaxID=55529 RepID=A0A7S4PQU6_GUITH|mmetsp:Transcript_9602/g.32161  ORF Transcript_9602/g.32161 Transcript_9602/m.32161 type:complete len:382 (+) Transcript_9602:87-1232(+)